MNHRHLTGFTALTLTLALSLAGCASLAGPAPAVARPDPQALLGSWTVDLRPRPDAPAYLKTFTVTAVKGNTFEGSFYDTPLTEGRINADWGTLRIAFVTRDGSGPYHHSAVLVNGQLEGLTNATGRGFLSYWRAARP